MSKFAQQDYGNPRQKNSWISRPYAILLTIFTIVVLSLFYFAGPLNINLDLDQTPLGSSDEPQAIKDTTSPLVEAISEATSSPSCKIGDLYGSCLNEIRFFQCTPDGPLAHPCPAGQKFFCTGEGEGECDSRHSTKWSGKGFEMVCEGEEELGACRKVQ